MFTNCYKVADHVFKLESIYEYAQKFLKDYKSEEEPSFIIHIQEEDIQKEKEESNVVNPGTTFSDPYLETLAIYRKFVDKIIEDNCILIHGALIEKDGYGYLFVAPSGTGKTTHIRLYMKRYPGEVTIINGDKPILHITDNGIVAYGTPWCGKEGYNKNTSTLLKGIIEVNRGEKNEIHKISSFEALTVLYKQTYHFEEEEKQRRWLSLLSKLTKTVSFYSLHCNMEIEAAEVSWKGISKEQSFEDILNENGKLVYTSVGFSMYPLIHERNDVLTIEKKTRRLKKYEIGLYKANNGHYVLHRVRKVYPSSYDFVGDHNYFQERDIKEENVIGILTKITREGKEVPLLGKEYEKYAKWKIDGFYLRAIFGRVKSLLHRIKNKIWKKK